MHISFCKCVSRTQSFVYLNLWWISLDCSPRPQQQVIVSPTVTVSLVSRTLRSLQICPLCLASPESAETLYPIKDKNVVIDSKIRCCLLLRNLVGWVAFGIPHGGQTWVGSWGGQSKGQWMKKYIYTDLLINCYCFILAINIFSLFKKKWKRWKHTKELIKLLMCG